jgi:diguanylate cyclase (GGDEF)-like protein
MRTQAGTPDGPPMADRWLLERYWLFGWLIFAIASPLLLLLGSDVDQWGAGGYVAVTAIGWLVGRQSERLGIRLHLLLLFPYWTWFSGLEGGLPLALGVGTGGFVLMLVFPVLTLVTVEGYLGAAASLVVGGGCLLWRWPSLEGRLQGAFLLGVTVLLGLVFRRLATELASAQTRLHHMAYHDDLTSLGNRRLLQQRAAEWLREEDSCGALLFVDLDRFKTVNDVLGHTVGDQILRIVAKRIADATPETALATRIGGDEFAVLLPDVDSEKQAKRIADDIVYRLCEPIDVSERSVQVDASVGIAMWPAHGRTLEGLMQRVDLAIYRSKKQGVSVAVHEEAHHAGALSSRGLEVDMNRAIEDGQLRLDFQPIVRLSTLEVVGAEALVRWQHPSHGLLPPAAFIESAEETGHIVAIDRWVLRQAAKQAKSWSRAGFDGWISVNISARTLLDDMLLSVVKEVLATEKLDPSQLVLELTESAAMTDPDASFARLRALALLGVDIAIDDFGMGYSSLAYLKRLPARHLKIDRSFTSGIGEHSRDEELIELVLQLAAKWNLEIIAEGVETEEQLDWLRDKGCELGQGYHFGRPTRARDFVTRTLGFSGRIEVPASLQRREELVDEDSQSELA